MDQQSYHLHLMTSSCASILCEALRHFINAVELHTDYDLISRQLLYCRYWPAGMVAASCSSLEDRWPICTLYRRSVKSGGRIYSALA